MKNYFASRKFYPETILVLIILVLVVIRINGTHSFRPGAERIAEAALKHSNLLDTAGLYQLSATPVLLLLDTTCVVPAIGNKVVPASYDELFRPPLLKKLRNAKAPLVLVSKDLKVSAMIWMVLAQAGVKDMYILCDPEKTEAFPYLYPSDSLVRKQP